MTDVKLDRREILPLIGPHFPSLDPKISSEDLHGFLNAQTGLAIPLDALNANAFDAWRIALANTGLPVWDSTPQREAEIKTRGEQLVALEVKRVADEAVTLAALAKEAPFVPAADLLKK
jgi:hypothetical protein